jgi:hypothetical protein
VTPPPADDVDEGPADDSFKASLIRPPTEHVSPAAGEAGTARINLRLPEHLKGRIEEAATREGLSVNAWLVRAAAAVLEPAHHGQPGDRDRPRDRGQPGGRRAPWGGQRYTGWVR